MSDPTRARTLVSSVAVLLTLALLGTAASCRPEDPPSVSDYLKKSHIYGEKVLRIGVLGNQPLMSQKDGSGRYTGFDAEIARLVADGLGYSHEEEIEWVELNVESRVAALQGNDVDIVVGSFTINKDRAALVGMAGPYFVTTQEALIRVEDQDKIKTLDDLKIHSVCVTGGSTSLANLRSQGVVPHARETDEECANGVLNHEYDVLSTDETVLAGFKDTHPGQLTIVQMPFGGSEPLGIGVPVNDPYLKGVIGHILLKNYRQGESSRWQAAYNSTLLKVLGPKRQPAPLDVPELLDHDELAPQGGGVPRAVLTSTPVPSYRTRRRGAHRGRR